LLFKKTVFIFFKRDASDDSPDDVTVYLLWEAVPLTAVLGYLFWLS